MAHAGHEETRVEPHLLDSSCGCERAEEGCEVECCENVVSKAAEAVIFQHRCCQILACVPG